MKKIIRHLLFTILFYHGLVSAFAAGVLPYAWHDNQMWLLFGQEARWIRNLFWQDFGGSAKQGQPEKDAAAREFSEETRAIWGDSYTILNDAGFDILDLNEKVDENKKDSITRHVKKNKTKKLNDLVEVAMNNSISYIIPRLSDEFHIYRKKYNYHQFFAEVDYIEIDTIRSAPKIDEYDKVDYAWVPLGEFKEILEEAQKQSIPNQKVYVPNKYTSGKYNRFGVHRTLADTLLDQRGQQMLNKISQIEQDRRSQANGQPNLSALLNEFAISLTALEQQVQLN